MKTVGLGFRCGYGDRQHADGLDGNSMVLILQNALDAKEFLTVNHAAVFFVKIGIHDYI